MVGARSLKLAGILVLCMLGTTVLISCEKGVPLSEMGPPKYVGSDK